MEIGFLSSIFLILTPLFLFFIVKKYSRSSKNLPPGPQPWPIIGNILQIGNNPHVSIAIFAQQYGPLISLQLGTQLLVVASSPDAALGILKTHDRLLSSRSIPNAFDHSFAPFYLVWSADCGQHWRSLRTLCRNEMFSVKALQDQSSMRLEKLGQMLGFLHGKKGQVVNIGDVVFTTIFNTLSNVFFAKDFLDFEDEHRTAGGLKEKLFTLLQDGMRPNISDFFPMFKRFDLQGLRKGNLKNIREVFSFWEHIVDERRALLNSSTTVMEEEEKSFLDRLLENGFSNDQINICAMELFIGGTDTTTSTIEWAMAELLKNKEAMSRVQEELKYSCNDSKIISESQLSKLSYLNACIKETLRLHPPVPFLIPRCAFETCEVMNYTIPQDTQIFINVWAIGRDPKVWEAPLSFKPERFLGLNLDFKGQDFEFIPFGAGRRMCPGLPSGIKSVQSILASLIHQFEWVLPDDEDPAKLDMKEKFGVTLQKEKALQLIFKDLN
ncbi:probable (S)-N-methylcoclaurine 3'-hydroxylase isozyme 2 [Cynara cardunculus var. scolymus]|uniref:probable (S)-N-methylcoclaurine 3'-hydroxylase isozyme 2 n=1 Tax=Cynara cardunculus var. scolymus TaxID=59895 RepID=UPI000D6270F8|nr:probable (S)-N-methylcoclaurine 3'-hydroxylase isozyme 2 [Cynara cardunculus var. scolymus]